MTLANEKLSVNQVQDGIRTKQILLKQGALLLLIFFPGVIKRIEENHAFLIIDDVLALLQSVVPCKQELFVCNS